LEVSCKFLYRWWIASGVVYLIERVYREWRGRRKTRITKVIQHPSKTIEIQIKKASFKAQAGQYIFICCPEIGLFEWHPFTLTSSPYEDFVSIHTRVVGDWTTKFAYRLGCRFGDKGEDILEKPSTLPFVMIDGGFGSASEDVFDYEAAILVGAGMFLVLYSGIGVTPFASILKDIWYRYTNNTGLKELKKVYFVWTCRDKEVCVFFLFSFQAFEWFSDLLITLEEENLDQFLEIHTFLTAKLKVFSLSVTKGQ
jgi:predicted ferric reductase